MRRTKRELGLLRPPIPPRAMLALVPEPSLGATIHEALRASGLAYSVPVRVTLQTGIDPRGGDWRDLVADGVTRHATYTVRLRGPDVIQDRTVLLRVVDQATVLLRDDLHRALRAGGSSRSTIRWRPHARAGRHGDRPVPQPGARARQRARCAPGARRVPRRGRLRLRRSRRRAPPASRVPPQPAGAVSDPRDSAWLRSRGVLRGAAGAMRRRSLGARATQRAGCPLRRRGSRATPSRA